MARLQEKRLNASINEPDMLLPIRTQVQQFRVTR
jgi:hypothetical protein